MKHQGYLEEGRQAGRMKRRCSIFLVAAVLVLVIALGFGIYEIVDTRYMAAGLTIGPGLVVAYVLALYHATARV